MKYIILLLLIISCNKRLIPEVHTRNVPLEYGLTYTDDLVFRSVDTLPISVIDTSKRFQLYDTIPIVLIVADTAQYQSDYMVADSIQYRKKDFYYNDALVWRKGFQIREKYYYDTDSLRYIASDGQPMLRPQYKTIGYLDENKKPFPKSYLIKPFL